MNIVLPIYRRRIGGGWYQVASLGLGPHSTVFAAADANRAQQKLVAQVKSEVAGLKDRRALRWFETSTQLKLERVRLNLAFRGGKKKRVSGRFPFVIEPVWLDADTPAHIAYHPCRADAWFPCQPDVPLDEQVRRFVLQDWAGLDNEELRALRTDGRDSIRIVAFAAQPTSLLDDLSDRPAPAWAGLSTDGVDTQESKVGRGPRVPLETLPQVGTDLTVRAAEGRLAAAFSRPQYDANLRFMLTGGDPVVLIGEPGAGKVTLLRGWVERLLAEDGFHTHQNLDRVRHVWQLKGQRLIAGMKHVGEWEERAVAITREARHHRAILWADDLAAWARIGRSRESERSLASFFRGPLERGEVTIVGAVTPAAWSRLEDDAPAFAAQFTTMHVAPATRSETLGLLLQVGRALERELNVMFDADLFRDVVDHADALIAGAVLPGKAIDLLRDLGPRNAAPGNPYPLDNYDLIELLEERTGMPSELLDLGASGTFSEPDKIMAQHLLGQSEAVRAMGDLVATIQAGLTDPRRPYGVYLFTGPTGTGKTEMAKRLTTFLYGSIDRLLRFDMGEYSGPDAPSRLIGDAWRTEGALTQSIIEQPFQVVLLDEIEKAHPLVLNLLLQLLDEGRLTDAAGRTAHFTHTVVIATSNLGARERAPVGFGKDEDGQQFRLHVSRAVADFFPPELFNRIDQIVIFEPLSQEAARAIAKRELKALLGRRGLSERDVFVYAADSVIDRVISEGFDVKLGARTLKRWLERHVAGRLAGFLASPAAASSGADETARLLMVHLDHDDAAANGLSVDVHTVTEMSATSATFGLEALWLESVKKLVARLPAALDRMDEWLAETEPGIAERLSQCLAATLDHSETEVPQALGAVDPREKGGVGEGDGGARAPTPDALEASLNRQRAYFLDQFQNYSRSVRGRLGYLLAKRAPRREELLAALSEVEFVQRLAPVVEDLSMHQITVVIDVVGTDADLAGSGRSVSGTLLGWLSDAYMGLNGDGSGLPLECRIAKSPAPRYKASNRAIEVEGLGARLRLNGELGCHVWRSPASGSQVAEVRALDDDATKLGPLGGEGASTSLVRLPEIVRQYRFDPQAKLGSGSTAPIEVEDYRMSFAPTLSGRDLKAVIAACVRFAGSQR